jgi:soluble lytic murein transglycosylase-like protein
MNLHLNNVKMEQIVPVFFGCLCSLVVCTLLAVRQLDAFTPEPETPETASVDAAAAATAAVAATADADFLPFPETGVYSEIVQDIFFEPETVGIFTDPDIERRDIIQEWYRRIETRTFVIDYFAEICPTRELAEIILVYADLFDIPPALALALAWEESRLDPDAVNIENKNGSTDRGLFQLNNRSFPRVDKNAFYSPDVNARHAMNHLRYCLDTGGTEIAALAMYNAGAGRVVPRATLDYISRILENRLKIENRFGEREALYQEEEEVIPEIVAEAKHSQHSRLVPLKPLAGTR